MFFFSKLIFVGLCRKIDLFLATPWSFHSTSVLDGGERSASRPVLITSVKESVKPLNRRLGWPQSRSGRFGKEKHFSPLLGFEPPDRRTRILVAISTASQLPVFHRTHFRVALRSVHEAGTRERVIWERTIGVRGAGCQPSRQHLLLMLWRVSRASSRCHVTVCRCWVTTSTSAPTWQLHSFCCQDNGLLCELRWF